MPQPALLEMTCAQKGLWLAHHCGKDRALYNVAELISIRGPLDAPRLLAAIEQSFAACDTFHQRYLPSQGAEKGSPAAMQLHPQERLRAYKAEFVEAPGLSEQALIDRHLTPDLKQGVDLERDLLFRSILFKQADQEHCLYLRSHHIAIDGLGLALFVNKIWESYAALEKDPEHPGPKLPSVVQALQAWRGYADSPRRDEDAQYWRHTLCTRSAVRYAASNGPVVDHPVLVSLDWSTQLLSDIEAYAQSHKIPQSVLWTAALARAVQAVKPAPELSLGLPYANRFGSPVAGVPCMWMNLLPLRVQADAQQSLAACARSLLGTMKGYNRHRYYRHEWIRKELRERQGHPDLFGPVFNAITMPRGPEPAGLVCASKRLSGGPVQDLTLTWIKPSDANIPRIELELPAQLASPERFEAWSEQLQLSFEQGMHKGGPQSQPATPPSQHPIVQKLAEHAQRQGDALAIDAKQGDLSYQELWDAASGVAQRLEGASGPILLWTQRGPKAIVAMLGALMAKRAYAPVDAQGPMARNLEIITALSPALLLHDQALPRDLVELAREQDIETLDLRGSMARKEEHPPARPLFEEDLAYWMHTSGSTGKARAVGISRDALAAFVQAAQQRYRWTPKDRVFHFAPLAFDASVEEIFVSLYAGATLVVRADEDTASIDHFITAIRRKRVSVLDLPTAFWHEWVYAAKDNDLGLPSGLRQVIIGGEAVLPDRVKRWRALAPPEIELLNTYGPTESTVVVSVADLHAPRGSRAEQELEEGQPLSIGKALSGTELILLDDAGQRVAPGQSGEIAVRSAQVCQGYADAPLHNASAFVLDPQSQTRVYKTGDLGQFNQAGELLFLGRKDEEVKISGFRIHPGEVESALLDHPAITHAAVLVHRPSQGSAYLVAHVQANAQTLEIAALRRDLATKLIASALPRSIEIHAELPKTSSGKLDRKKLARQESSPLAQTELEGLPGKIAAVWQELLQVPVTHKDADFFELGGESLHCLQLATRLSELLSISLDANFFMAHPQLGALCAAIERGDWQQDPHYQDQVRTRMHEDLAEIEIPPVSKPGTPAAAAGRHVLLTGATGYIGEKLLAHLAQDSTRQITCLVRTLPATPLNFAAKVHWLAGDLSQDKLGLAPEAFAQLGQDIDSIVHCAGSVNLMHDYEKCRKTNVQGTRTLLELMGPSSAKGAPPRFIALSTLAVAPGPQEASQIPESPFAWHPGLHNGYTQSKWVSEQALVRAHALGHRSCALRIGRAYGQRQNPNDLLSRVARACRRNRVWPQLDVRESWIHCQEIALLVESFLTSETRWPAVVNASDGQNYHWPQLFEQLRQSTGDKPEPSVPLDEWLSTMQSQGELEDRAVAALLAPLTRVSTDAPYLGSPPAQNKFWQAHPPSQEQTQDQTRYQAFAKLATATPDPTHRP